STVPDDVVFRPGQPLFRRPRHSASLGLSWNRQRVTATLNGIFIGRFIDSDFVLLDPPLVSNPGYTTWDARLSYKLSLHLAALVSIDNATSAEYMEPLGYPALRRAVRAGVHVDF